MHRKVNILKLTKLSFLLLRCCTRMNYNGIIIKIFIYYKSSKIKIKSIQKSVVSHLEEILRKYREERFDFENASLNFSVQTIQITLHKGEKAEGFFQMTSQDEEPVKGYLYTSNLRMACIEREFYATQCDIHYCFDTKGLEEETTSEGEIMVVTDRGEYSIPYTVLISLEENTSTLGNIRNLFHFANLAKSNWKEAVQLFYSSKFIKILDGADRQYFNTYKGLFKDFGNEQNVEEFLIAIHKKQQIDYILETDKISISNPENVVSEQIKISKNGWGYVSMHVFVEGDFLSVEKEYLTDDNFLGNVCTLDIFIYSHKLHAGTNYGMIRLVTPYGEMTVPVTVTQSAGGKENKEFRQKELILLLMNDYLDFRFKKRNMATWITKTGDTIEKLIRLDETNPAYRMFQAQLLMTQERYNEAKWILDHVDDMVSKGDCAPEIYCYYLYLNTLYNREEEFVNEQLETIEEIFLRNPSNWRIAWLLLYVREELGRVPAKKWKLIEDLFYCNSYSPILYTEAVMLLNANPILLQKLDSFEIQLLNFATKKQILSPDVLPQIHYLMSKRHKYADRLLYILKYCYQLSREEETLQEICELLIRGNQIGEKYFEWYQLGVESQLRITRLYEHYLMSIPITYNGKLPKIVLMYFAYSNDLSYERKAFLYANVLRYQNEYPEIVRSYQSQMESFLAEQLQKGHINNDLAILYENLIHPTIMGQKIAKPLAPLLFQHQLVLDPHDSKAGNIRQIVVIHGKMKGEVRYPVINGKAMISIYGDDHMIFFQDGFGNRYVKGIGFTIHKFLNPDKFLPAFKSLDMDFPGMDLLICEGCGDFVTVHDDNFKQFARIAESDQIREEYKRDIRTKLLYYYFDRDMIPELDAYLNAIKIGKMKTEELSEFIQFMILRGMYDKALEWIQERGPEGIPGKVLVRLCSRLYVRNEFEWDAYLAEIGYLAFKLGKYDESILTYLVKYFKGTTKQLRDIWRAAINFDVDTYYIEERLLIQMLFSRAFITEAEEVFRYYARKNGRGDVKEAYLTRYAYEYFIKDRVIEKDIFQYFIEPIQEEKEINLVCKLAFLKFYAENKQYCNEEAGKIVVGLLYQVMPKGIYFSYFMHFADLLPQIEIMADYTILEYKAEKKCKVIVHYIYETEDEHNIEYRKEEMTSMYNRLYAKSFLLFFGESVQYYITEEDGETSEVTESGTIRKNDIAIDKKESRFSMLNDLSIASTLQDYDTIWQLLSEYSKTEYLVNGLFKTI